MRCEISANFTISFRDFHIILSKYSTNKILLVDIVGQHLELVHQVLIVLVDVLEFAAGGAAAGANFVKRSV